MAGSVPTPCRFSSCVARVGSSSVDSRASQQRRDRRGCEAPRHEQCRGRPADEAHPVVEVHAVRRAEADDGRTRPRVGVHDPPQADDHEGECDGEAQGTVRHTSSSAATNSTLSRNPGNLLRSPTGPVSRCSSPADDGRRARPLDWPPQRRARRDPVGRSCGCSSMVEHQLPKLRTRVRFPSPAPGKPPAQRPFPLAS